MAANSKTLFAYDDHTSIPFKLVHLKAVSEPEQEYAHRHNCFQLFFFTHGGGKHLIDFEHEEVQSSSVHIVNPGNVHSLTRTNTTQGHVLLFSRTFFDKQHPDFRLFLYRNDFSKFLPLPKADFNQLMDKVKTIDQELQANHQMNEEAVRLLLQLIVINIQRAISFQLAQQSSESNVLLSYQKLIEVNFTQVHLVSFYAEKLNISSKKLNEITKAGIGKTAGELIQDRLLLEAKRMLFYGRESAKEIAFTLGYEDPSYFNRFFKKHTSLTPVQYRESRDQ